MLFILAVWRSVYKKLPFTYDPLYWGAVFPLGMYTVATYQMDRALNLYFLQWLPNYFVFIAAAVWIATFSGMVRRIAQTLFGTGHRH